MEQEGIYYFFRHEQDRHVLVLADAYGAHTTVLHACRKINELKESDADIREDYKNLLRTLTT